MNQGQVHDTTLTMQSMAPGGVTVTSSPFGTHRLQVKDHLPVAHRQEQPDWVFIVLAAGFILVAWTVFFYFKRFRTFVSAAFSKRYLSQLTREGNILRERIAVSLTLVYLLAMAMTIYQWNELYFGWDIPRLEGFRLFLLVMLLLVLFWTMKFFAMNFLSIVFRTHQNNYEYMLNILLFSVIAGLVSLPLLVFAVYLRSTEILVIILVISVLLFLFRFYKGMMIGAALTRFSYLFLFVYLCALELLPLVVILKLTLIYSTP